MDPRIKYPIASNLLCASVFLCRYVYVLYYMYIYYMYVFYYNFLIGITETLGTMSLNMP